MPSSIIDAQVHRLLEIVDDYQKQQCEELLVKAKEQAGQVVRNTYRSARKRLRTHIQEDRQQLDQSLAAVRAKRHTFMMQQKHQGSQKFLQDCWKLLSTKLEQRWNNFEYRQQWAKTVVDIALLALPDTEWQIEHVDGWEQSEQKQLMQYLSGQSQINVEFKAVQDINTGLRISAGGAVVDGTLEGLLSDRVRIESEIIARCNDCIVYGNASELQKGT